VTASSAAPGPARPQGRVEGSNSSSWYPLALTAALALAAALRFQVARLVPPWFAEIYILKVSARPFAEMMRLARADIGPPLLLVLRWFWTRLGGSGGLWQKSFSILLALASLAVFVALARRAFGKSAAILTAFLIALSPALTQYSQEIDSYALLWLLIATMLVSAWAWSDRPGRGAAIAYVLAAALALYTEYQAMLVWILTAIVIATRLPAEGARRRSWLLLNLAVIVCFLPQAPTFVEQFARESYGRYWRFPTPAVLRELWTTMSFGSRWALVMMAPLALVPLFRTPTRRLAVLLWLLLVLAPFATRVFVVILPREGLYIAPLLMMLAAGGIVAIPHRVAQVVLAALLLAFGVRAALHPPLFAEAVTTGQAADFVAARSRPGELVVHAEPHSLFMFLYQHPELRSRLLREPGDRLPFFEGGLMVPDSLYLTPAEWRAEIAPGGRWWGVWVNRAIAAKGVVWRAGAAEADSLRVAVGDSVWHQGPVTIWEANPAAAR
jgi:hypothetical protein